MPAKAHMLNGYRVLDFSQVVAGPTATRLFESTDNKLGDESELFRDIEA